MLAETVRKSVVYIDFKSFFIKHENFIRKMWFSGRKISKWFLEIFIDHLLNLLFAHFVLRLDLFAHKRMFEDFWIYVRLFASMTEHFELLKDLSNFVVKMLWLLLRFASRFWTHPYHICVDTRLTLTHFCFRSLIWHLTTLILIIIFSI